MSIISDPHIIGCQLLNILLLIWAQLFGIRSHIESKKSEPLVYSNDNSNSICSPPMHKFKDYPLFRVVIYRLFQDEKMNITKKIIKSQ